MFSRRRAELQDTQQHAGFLLPSPALPVPWARRLGVIQEVSPPSWLQHCDWSVQSPCFLSGRLRLRALGLRQEKGPSLPSAQGKPGTHLTRSGHVP